ncbi:NTP transferase domain-containing protein [Candidatus Peregrinibacteria bacterium]|nr:NTP transferase domain-containing protein [Candidatus Peregrinibacteria bacterium]
MKGIILAGGEGTRLHPLTKVTSKQLLPIYDQPMIYYPLSTLLKAGIRDILIIVSPGRSGDFLNLLGSGKEFGARFTYEIQDKAEGIAQAILIGEDFIDGESCALILGDNIFTDDFSGVINSFKSGAKIFVKKVPDAKRFGVVEMDSKNRILSLEEKPANPKSDFAQTGFYLYDPSVVARAKSLKPSGRKELEITDLNKTYLEEDKLQAEIVEGEWIDAGTFESLYKASTIIRRHKLGFHGEKESLKVIIRGQAAVKASETVFVD